MRYLFFMLFLASVSLISCSKEDSNDYYWGTASAQLNEDSWQPEPRAVTNKPYGQGIDFSLGRFNGNGLKKEALFIYKIPPQVGRHPISQTDLRDIDSLSGARLFTLIDGDVLGDVYHPLEGPTDNYLEITKIDGDEIWAEFQIAFVQVSVGSVDTNYPDTIRLTQGKIHTRIIKPD
ncbi:MAG: hypothetical protein IT261_00555 [Saprospiraceae bacterium]|nr:hypothetical protein [Saprospiraceae bacterium]